MTAAARLFAEQGLSVPLEDVARSAGVGVATLYRRFPTRTDLAIAAFERNMTSYEDAVEKALNNPVAWDGFRDLVYDVCALQASDPGLRALLTTAFPASSVIEQRATEAVDKLGQVIARAQQDGMLRPDIGVGRHRGDAAGQHRGPGSDPRARARCLAQIRRTDGRLVPGRSARAAAAAHPRRGAPQFDRHADG